ncbi:MAG: Smr/MutS family protein [Saprospiraceae bacterium]|nr:Smr/MutS family protein [Saprospiraceae bacterium]MBK9679841.1 Smr/MutS family protein [Saprospiraceae bacterium]
MLTIRPDSLFQNLEFDKISNLVRDLCLIGDTKTTYFPLTLYVDKTTLDQQLDEVQECKRAYEQSTLIPIKSCQSIQQTLEYISVEDYALDHEALLLVLAVLVNLEELKTYFNDPAVVELSPLAYNQFVTLAYESSLYQEFKKIFDDHGQVRPDASPELKTIARSLKSKEHEIDQVFKSLLAEYRKNGWLSESGESIRNNRRVVAVNAEHKRKLRGIIHDESSTGRTTYIEPEAILEKNNELFELEIEYQKEIYRLFKLLSQKCHSQVDMLRTAWEVLLHFDFVRAKTLLSARYAGCRPEIYDRPQLKIKSGRHPLLLLKNQPLKKPTIPFDLILLGENRILILSGPNAGGKSVAMKAGVLIQMMLQSGLLIPVHEASEMGLFHSFLGDIGDHQSLEEDLSTYSSRLLLMKQFMEVADERSLICIDEFGSGTDPKLGGAIAEAILLALNKKKVFGIITTHYSNLKVLAYKTKGLLNGAMVFDTELLKPTFQLKVGRPGSSYAFEVATRSGLDPIVIEQAKQRTHQDQKELEELLIELQRDKALLEEQVTRSKEKEDRLDKLIKTYEQLAADFEIKRKKLKLEQKSWEVNATKEIAHKVDKALREVKSTQLKNPVQVQNQKQHQKIKIEALTTEVKSLDMEIAALEKIHSKPIVVGSHVKLKNGSEIGQVLSMRNGLSEVAIGSIQLNIATRDLIAVRSPVEDALPLKTKTILVEEKKVESSLDLRGMSKAQAIELLENYLDRALLSNVHEVKILHGKGTGILRDVVRSQARQYKAIKNILHPPEEAGGDGISILQIG